MVSNRRRLWAPDTLKALQVRCRLFGGLNLRVVAKSGIWKIGKGCYRAYGNLTYITKHKASIVSFQILFDLDF